MDKLFFSENIPFDLIISQIKGCQCRENCQKNNCNCLKTHQCYRHNKFLFRCPESITEPIYECNSDCECNKSCLNRFVQLDNKINGYCKTNPENRNRGLFASRDIDKYEYICNYNGEYITSEESESREKQYSISYGKNFILNFILQFGSKRSTISIDGGPLAYDNDDDIPLSAFINHSCNPNLHIVPVYVDNPNFPVLSFFTKRTIIKDEELTFSYCQDGDNNIELSDKLCLCGSDNCRGFMPRFASAMV